MNKDEVAVFLDENPDFFNDFPNLLQKIQSLETASPQPGPQGPVDISDRLLKRAQADRDQMQDRLEWILRITQSNDRIQENLFEVEKTLLTATGLAEMLVRFRKEMIRRFEIPGVLILLADDSETFVTDEWPESLENADGVRLTHRRQLAEWFGDRIQPVLQGKLAEPSPLFRDFCPRDIRSVALIPMLRCQRLAGVLCLGSDHPEHFHEGLRTDYLERTADKLAWAVNNLLLLEFLRTRRVTDPITGLYNSSFLIPALRMETDKALRRGQPLALVKIRIDSHLERADNEEKPQQKGRLREIAGVLRDFSRDGDTLIRADGGVFWILIPGVHEDILGRFLERIQESLSAGSGVSEAASGTPACGTALFPGPGITGPEDLIRAASETLEWNPEGILQSKP